MKKLLILVLAIMCFSLPAKAYKFVSSDTEGEFSCFNYKANYAGKYQPLKLCAPMGVHNPRKVADKMAYNVEHPVPMTKKELRAYERKRKAEIEQNKKLALIKPTKEK